VSMMGVKPLAGGAKEDILLIWRGSSSILNLKISLLCGSWCLLCLLCSFSLLGGGISDFRKLLGLLPTPTSNNLVNLNSIPIVEELTSLDIIMLRFSPVEALSLVRFH
jgi:hypothetical protein